MDAELIKVIDKLIQDRTFSLEAVTAIKAMKDRLDAVEKSNVSVEKAKVILENSYSQVLNDLKDMGNQLDGWRKREQDLIVREAKAAELEKDTAVAQASECATRETMDRFLRNVTIRENVQKQIPMEQNGYISSQQQSENKEITKE